MRARRWFCVGVLLVSTGGGLCLLWLQQLAKEQPYAAIEDGLYVGASVKSPPPGTSAVLNLCHQQDAYSVDHMLWEPIDGGQAPSIDWLRRVVNFIDVQRQAGRTTYVHCLAGMNRSGMVITAYLMYKHGWKRDQALAFAQRKRPQIQPNIIMMRLLAEWEQVLAKQRAAE